MTRLKSSVLVSVLAIGIMGGALAQENKVGQSFTDDDTQLIFKQDDRPLEVAALSSKG